jgi:hypothetical protein
MRRISVKHFLSLTTIAAILPLPAITSGCVSSSQALEMETRVNCSIMKDLQDNDEDLVQIEDGTGTVGDAATCPT